MKILKEYENLNKYGLTPKTITNLIPNRDKIQEKPFWRNNAISAWCLSDNTIHSDENIIYSIYNEYWLGVYDEDANNSYAGKVRFHLSSYGGMCSYHPSEFLKSDEIENKDDLEIQVRFLKCINQLIDNGTFSLSNKNRKRK